MIPYTLYVALILTACLIFYKLLLQKETFFHLNRFVLLLCMLLAFILPLIRVPPQLSLRNIQAAVSTIIPAEPIYKNTIPQSTGKNITTPAAEPLPVKQSLNFEQATHWIMYLYWFGVVVFAFNFLMQAILLLYKAYSKPAIKDGKFRIVEVTGNDAPCSFGNNIFINPANYDWNTYSQVLLHEKIHIEQKHTIDLLIAEIVLAFQWFNPFAWVWRKELESNLEFFTDQRLLQQPEIERETYQLSLLKVAAPHFPLSLTTNYNQSLIKKRILMMNAKRSNLHTTWKYFFLLPLMMVFVCLFNEPVVKAQSAAAKVKPHPHNNGDIQTSGNWFATIKGDKINIQFRNDDEGHSSNGTTFQLSEFKDLPKDKPGTFTLTREAGTMEFKGKFDGDKGMGEYQFKPDKSYSDAMYKEGIDVKEDRDGMVFFLVNVKRSYVQMLKQQGYTDLDKDKLVPLAALDINEAYITSIKQAGFTRIDLDNLVPFKALNVDKAYIEEIRNTGYKDITPDKIITFKAQGIDGKYIADFRNSTNNELKEKNEDAVNQKNNKNLNLDKGKNKALDLTGNRQKNKNLNNDDDDLIAFKALKIDEPFINSFKEVGYNNLSNSNLISMKAVGVTPVFIKSFRDAGFTNINADDLVSLKAQDVTPSLVKQYKALGFDNISLNDVIGAKATGTSPSFIVSMREKGHNMKSLDKYIALRSVLGE
ncbi:MAG: peptidase BlaR1 [Ferruginibacter sp.]|nr:peptidase BlaR1 [Ferruginibacter sp.]